MSKKAILEKFNKTGKISDEDWKYCESVDWHPVDERPLRKEFIEKMKKIEKSKGIHFKNIGELREHIENKAKKPTKTKKILVFGTFDLLHPGHIHFFSQARKHGDYLIAVVARDKTVEAVKGRKPLHSERKRLAEVKKHVSHAMLGSTGDKYAVVEEIKPDVICLGYDQDSFTAGLNDELKKRKLKARTVRLKPYRQKIYKSSKLRKKLKLRHLS